MTTDLMKNGKRPLIQAMQPGVLPVTKQMR